MGVEIAREEAQRTLEANIKILQNQSNQSLSIIKINFLLLSLIAAGTRVVRSIREIYIYALLVFPLIAIMLSMFAYVTANPTLGMNKEGVQKLMNESDADSIMGRVYSSWADDNHQSIALTQRILVWSLAATSGGLGAIMGVIVWIL